MSETNWIQRLVALLDAIKAITDALPDAGALTTIQADLTTLDTRLSAVRAGYLDELDFDLQGLLNTIAAYLTTEIADILTDTGTTLPGLLSTIQTDLDNPSQYMADLSTLETRLSAVRAGYLDELDFALQEAIAAIPTTMVGTDSAALASVLEDAMQKASGPAYNQDTDSLEALREAIDTIAGVNTYQEQIPDTDFSLAAIDTTLTSDPPSADGENSVVDIDANAGDTFVLRSLIVNITSFGTGTKLIFKLWVPVNGTITEVDAVDVTSTGLQNIMDIFGLREVHADSIHITVQTDSGTTGACEGTWKYAKAS